jgi:angio-associated migratory cell protein
MHQTNRIEKSVQEDEIATQKVLLPGPKSMTMQTTEGDDDNNSDGDRMMVEEDLEEEDNELETAPAFLDPNDQAIEVPVDDYEPLAEEEDDEDQDQEDNNADASEQEQQLPEQDEMSTRQIHFHTGPIYAVEFVDENHSDRIVTGGGDDQAALHDITTVVDAGSSSGSRSLHQAKDSVVAIAVCANFIAIGSYDGRIIVLSSSSSAGGVATTGTEAAGDPNNNETATRFELDGPTDVEWLNFHPTGSVLLAGSTDGTVWMYSVSAKVGAQCMQVFVGHEAAVTAGAFLLKVAATCSADGTVRIWAPKTGLAKHVFRCSEMGLTCLAVGGGVDGKLVLAGGEDGMAYCCHIGSQKIIHRFEHTPRTAPVTAPMAVQRGDQDDDEEEEEELETPPISVEAVGFAPVADSTTQQQWCATAGVDGVLKIWDVTSGQCRHVCKVGGGVGGGIDTTTAGGITRLQWIAQHYVVTCGTTGIVRIWDARSGTLVHSLTARGRSVMNDLAVSVDNDDDTIKIVTGSDDGIARVFTVSKEVLQLSPAASPAL